MSCTERIKCPWCKLETIKASLPKHLRVTHQKTPLEYFLHVNGLTEQDVPKCEFCGKDCDATISGFQPTCGNPDCIKEWHHRNRSLSLSKRHKEAIANGTHNFLKHNLARDENGKSISNVKAAKKAVESGKCSILAKNRPRDEQGNDLLAKKIAAAQIEKGVFFGGHDLMSENATKRNLDRSVTGNHQWSKDNLKLNADGKSINHVKAAQTQIQLGNFPGLGRCDAHILHKDELNKETFESKFIINGRFKFDLCCQYFNLSAPTIKAKKREFGITAVNDSNRHIQQNQVYDFLKEIYEGSIVSNTRSVIPNLEIDLYLPDQHLAIEYDGLKFHSTGYNYNGDMVVVDKYYHLDKTILCEERGIQLLHIFDIEWMSNKRHIWKAMIRRLLNKVTVIDSDVCRVITDIKDIEQFLNENHIQGYAVSKYNYGLIYDNQLIAVMCFNESNTKTADYELVRYCELCDYTVSGGAQKLLEAFRVTHSGTIVSYENRRWGQGRLLQELSFQRQVTYEPEYYYFKTNDYMKLYTRHGFKKERLKGRKDFIYDESLSEKENMFNNGYMLVYDCGSFEYDLQ